MKKIIGMLLVGMLFFSCSLAPDEVACGQIVDCPEAIAAKAFYFAEQYRDTETVYVWGGQDGLRAALALDCSGLVVRCYGYAVEDSAYWLLFDDASSADFYERYARLVPLAELRQGDLLFMGEQSTDTVTHIALFDRLDGEELYFIDSTQKDTDGDGKNDIDGVTERHYACDDERIKAFGILQVGTL